MCYQKRPRHDEDDKRTSIRQHPSLSLNSLMPVFPLTAINPVGNQ
ncbi:MAG: hypothetical protein ACRD33_06335 [Candidatus Acidiferrales bacterium]